MILNIDYIKISIFKKKVVTCTQKNMTARQEVIVVLQSQKIAAQFCWFLFYFVQELTND